MTNTELIELLEELTSLPAETEWVEFKLGKGSLTDEQIGEYISAISNGATIANKPYGYLVWGVEDGTHRIKGTNFRITQSKHGGNQELEFFLRLNLNPKINFEIFEFEYRNLPVTLLRIPKAIAEPTCFQKKTFIRIGSNKTDLRNFPDLMRAIYYSQEDWSVKIIDNASINDLDEDAIHVARTKFKEQNKTKSFFSQIDSWDDTLFLDKAKITIDGKITRTAILLLGKEEATHYLLPAVAEITWKLDSEERAYEHFSTPFLLNTTKVMQRIRNIKHKFYPDHELLATTVDKYDPRSILEALNNCIAHQDYGLNSRILVTEQIDKLLFENAGNFYEGTPDEYATGTKTPTKYRNQWLANAMVNLGMIDRLGYGIHLLCLSQMRRFFPMPDYDLRQQNKVLLKMYGQAIDNNYSKMLIQRKDITLTEAILLDRVQKSLAITDHAAGDLRKRKLIEGRKPNYFVGAEVAQMTDKKAEYSKNKGLNKQYYLDFIMQAISQHGSMNRTDIDNLLWNKLPEIINEKQKKNMIGNLISELRVANKIRNSGSRKDPVWILEIKKDF